MKALLIWILAIAFASGAETVAWQVSLERIVEDGVKNPSLSRLKAHPAESVFFEEGDELWDLTDALEIQRWVPDDPTKTGKFDPGKMVRGSFAGDWLIWNARSKKVVGRGSWEDLVEIESKIVYPQVRARFIVEKNGRAEGSVVTVCGSGERAEGNEGKLVARAAPNLGWDRRRLDLSFEVHFDTGDGKATEVKSTVSIGLNKKIALAGWSDEGKRFILSGTFALVSEEGVSMNLVRQSELEGGLVGIKGLGFDYAGYDGMTLASGLMVGVFHLPPDFVPRIPELRPGTDFGFPSELEAFSSESYEDVSMGLKANGVSFDPNASLALVNHLTSTLIAVNDRVNLEKLGTLVETIEAQDPANVRCQFGWGESSRMLLVRSDELASIHQVREGTQESGLDVAPKLAADDRGIEMAIALNDPDQSVSLERMAAIGAGVPMLVGDIGKESEAGGLGIGEGEMQVRVTAWVERIE